MNFVTLSVTQAKEPCQRITPRKPRSMFKLNCYFVIIPFKVFDYLLLKTFRF